MILNINIQILNININIQYHNTSIGNFIYNFIYFIVLLLRLPKKANVKEETIIRNIPETENRKENIYSC